jgi:uncharacterized linocin/CFP29 family protein
MWTSELMDLARKIVVERFAQNSIAGHLAPPAVVTDDETTVLKNRFDFQNRIVVDRETLGLHEPFAFCGFTRAQADEFMKMIGKWKDGTMPDPSMVKPMGGMPDAGMPREATVGGMPAWAISQLKVVTTLTRAASALARWHDALFFMGYEECMKRGMKPRGVEMPTSPYHLVGVPQSLREAACEAEEQERCGPISVAPDAMNEALVASFFAAVLRLETLGYYSSYHLVLGERLWEALHRPTQGSLVLPKDRIVDTLLGGTFHRTTTLPDDEALLVSLDGPTFDCVMAGDMGQYPRFEFLRVEPAGDREELYMFRVRERFAPRIRENRAVVRLQIAKS